MFVVRHTFLVDRQKTHKIKGEKVMKTRFRKSGYSDATASKYIALENPIYSLSTESEKQFKYVDGKRTDEVTGYRSWYTQEGLPPFMVKFEKDVKLPKYLSLVKFENLQGIEIRYDVYFKADDVTEVK